MSKEEARTELFKIFCGRLLENSVAIYAISFCTIIESSMICSQDLFSPVDNLFSLVEIWPTQGYPSIFQKKDLEPLKIISFHQPRLIFTKRKFVFLTQNHFHQWKCILTGRDLFLIIEIYSFQFRLVLMVETYFCLQTFRILF